MSRRLLPLLVALVASTATACPVSVTTGIDVARDGSGRVTAGVGLDADALREVGDPATAFRVDDLRGAGWQVEGPRKEDDGLTWVRASKRFADPREAERVMAQLSGPAGPFRDFRLTRSGSLLRTRTAFTGTVDLTAGLAALTDPDFVDRLGGDPALDSLAGAVRVEVSAGLPGTIRSNAPTMSGGRAVWTPEMGSQLLLQAEGDLRRLGPIVYGAMAVLVAVAALALVGRRRRHALRSR